MKPADDGKRTTAPFGASDRIRVEAIVVRWVGEKIEARFRLGSLERTVLARLGPGLLRNGIHCRPGARVHLTGHLWSELFTCVWVGAGPRRSRIDECKTSGRQAKTAIRVANVPKEDFERLVESPSPPTVTELAVGTTIAPRDNPS